MIVPVGADSIVEAVRCGSEIFHTLKKGLADKGLMTAVGDEGGFAPNLASTSDALDFIMASIDKAGYKAGDDVMQIGRASCRERVCQYVSISVVAVSLKKSIKTLTNKTLYLRNEHTHPNQPQLHH